jgi:hypothetical protein
LLLESTFLAAGPFIDVTEATLAIRSTRELGTSV